MINLFRNVDGCRMTKDYDSAVAAFRRGKEMLVSANRSGVNVSTTERAIEVGISLVGAANEKRDRAQADAVLGSVLEFQDQLAEAALKIPTPCGPFSMIASLSSSESPRLARRNSCTREMKSQIALLDSQRDRAGLTPAQLMTCCAAP
jgi:hypothetical protein